MVNRSIEPCGGHGQQYYKSVFYNIVTVNRLKFEDFFKVTEKELITILLQKGYDYADNTEQPLQLDHADLQAEISRLLNPTAENAVCTNFHFIKKDRNIHLVIRLGCGNSFKNDVGINLTYLTPYIDYYEFKNQYGLWGKDASQLIGKEVSPAKTGNTIIFKDYTITQAGGYIIDYGNKAYNGAFAVNQWHSDKQNFLLFSVRKKENDNFKILDVLEINNKDLKNNMLVTEYCETDVADPEILAIVTDTKDNPEYYTQIIKAWKANRRTGKFEVIQPGTVKRCGNENDGI
jgi:hypothetical protein